MKQQNLLAFQFFGVLAILFACMQWGVTQTTPDLAGVPVSMVVTVQGHHGSNIPSVHSEDVLVYQSRARAKVTDWVPLQGDRAHLDLFILLDSSPGSSRGSRLQDIRDFILAQPAATKIGIAYMDTGGPKIVQDLTTDHKLAADALHVSLTTLTGSSSPYISLRTLIKQWPASNDRREILVISNGVDALEGDFGPNKDNVYVDSAIADAQNAGIIVSTIATRGESAGLSGSPVPPVPTVGSSTNHLAQVAEATGGESYYNPSGSPISFAPYLDDCARRFTHQYLLTFLAKPGKKAGTQSVKVRTEVPHAELVSAQRVYVPGTGQ
jgi:hypothetical protein